MPQRMDALRAQRIAAGLSIDQVAKRSGCAHYLIVQAEEGRPMANAEVVKIAAAIGVSVATLGAVDV